MLFCQVKEPPTNSTRHQSYPIVYEEVAPFLWTVRPDLALAGFIGQGVGDPVFTNVPFFPVLLNGAATDEARRYLKGGKFVIRQAQVGL